MPRASRRAEPGPRDTVLTKYKSYEGRQYTFSQLPPEPQTETGPYIPRPIPPKMPYRTSHFSKVLERSAPEFKVTRRKHPLYPDRWIYTRTYETRPHKSLMDRVSRNRRNELYELHRSEDSDNWDREYGRLQAIEEVEYREWKAKRAEQEETLQAEKKDQRRLRKNELRRLGRQKKKEAMLLAAAAKDTPDPTRPFAHTLVSSPGNTGPDNAIAANEGGIRKTDISVR